MEHYEQYEKTVTCQKLVRVTCDWCGNEIPQPRDYEVREFTLEFAKGSSYPDCGWKEGWQIEDLCDDCVEKLRGLLEEAKITIAGLEVDW